MGQFTRDKQPIFYHFNILCIVILTTSASLPRKNYTLLDNSTFGTE